MIEVEEKWRDGLRGRAQRAMANSRPLTMTGQEVLLLLAKIDQLRRFDTEATRKWLEGDRARSWFKF